ncbi:unnamed protein product, partial [Laminaria digitata]
SYLTLLNRRTRQRTHPPPASTIPFPGRARAPGTQLRPTPHPQADGWLSGPIAMTKQMLMEMVREAKEKRDYRKATEYLQRVLARYPEDKLAWEELGQCYLEIGSLENSLEAYRRAVALVKSDEGGDASGK